MKKFKIISLILAAAMILAVAAIASSCEKKNNNGGVIVDLPTGDATTATDPVATTAQTTVQTAEQTEATQATVATTAETVPTTPSQTEPTTATEPTATTAEATTAQTTATTEATTTTPATNPGVLEYDVQNTEFGSLRIKIEYVSPLANPSNPKAPNWKDASKTDIRQTCDLVARAKLVSIQEVGITVMGASTIYGSVLTLEIQQSYYSNKAIASTRIRVYCELSSRYTTTDATELTIGDEYYFFLESVEGNTKNTIGYENICDYFISLPPNVSYLIPARAEIINDSMIDLLKYNDRSGSFSYNPRDNFGYILEEILG